MTEIEPLEFEDLTFESRKFSSPQSPNKKWNQRSDSNPDGKRQSNTYAEEEPDEEIVFDPSSKPMKEERRDSSRRNSSSQEHRTPRNDNRARREHREDHEKPRQPRKNDYERREQRKPSKDEFGRERKERKKIKQENSNVPRNGESAGEEDRDKKSAMLYNLWQQSNQRPASRNSHSESSRNNSASRPSRQNILDRSPTLRDLHAVVFSTSSNFETGEIVMAPRTRGGFSYAKIQKQIIKPHCFFDPLVEHKCLTWRVVYNNNGKALYKDLPAPYIGKLPNGPSVNDTLDDMDGLIESPDNDSSRVVGEKPTLKDLQSVVFSAQCSFNTDEMVLVPRSAGGFTYGRIYKETKQNCKIVAATEETHALPSWRVIVNEDNPNNVTRKDLCAACIGKICLTNSTITLPKNRMALFKVCEEIPNLQMAAKKESEIEVEEEKSPIEDTEDLPEEIVLWEGESRDPNVSKDLKDSQSPPSSQSGSQNNQQQTTAPAPALQVGGILAIDKEDLFRKLMTPKEIKLNMDEKKHLIVLDGPNVAKKHGKDQEFSSEGLKIALKYWNEKGHDAIAFIPEHFVRRKPGQGPVTLKEYMPKATNVPMLIELVDKGKVVLTPPQDYDDSYIIDYAIKHNACIVTNDRYWDHIEKAATDKGKKARKDTLKWIREHVISFTFVRDEFLPNPNFKFPPLEADKKEDAT